MEDGGEGPGEARWWETAEDHRFALDVLQLPLRRKIMRHLFEGPKTLGEVALGAGLRPEQALYHLSLLEKALVVERVGDSYRLSPTGVLYIEKVEQRR